ncbi:MAG: Bug family tripartite tricarboxylate transporter substrate binding protein [Burkholderiales bacterium]
MNIRLALAIVLVAAIAAPAGALAQQKFPVKTVRLVLPFATGSAVDVLARLYAQKMSETWGQQVLVDNRTGVSGIVGMEFIARAAPDGYTLGMGNVATLAINPSLYAKLPYDVARDFVPILYAAAIRNSLDVHPSLPVRSVKELIALAQARPGQLNYASGGVGSAQHIPMEMLKAMAGIDIVHVSYKGLTPAFNDVLAGQVPMMVSGVVTALPHHKTGRLRIIATTGATRTQVTPEIPSIAEAGVPGYDFDSWTGFLAPAGTPPAIVAQVHAETARISRLPDMRERLTAAGFEIVGGPPEAFAALIKSNNARLGKVIRDAGIKAE